ncbi:MAG: molybdate ABC transporter substrate-binding protein [Cyanobacteria bacterium J06639_1]
MSVRTHRQWSLGLLASLTLALWAVGRSSPPSLVGSSRASIKVPPKTTAITVSAAASLQDVLEAIAPQFQTTHADNEVDFNFGSSGALQRQIEQGAPADVFFSAASRNMDELAERGAIASASRQDVVSNRLVLIAPAQTSLQLDTFAQLDTVGIDRFAVGDFRSTPAGQYAEQVLIHVGMLETLRPTFVFGHNVRSSLAAVASGNAEVGIVYATDAALSDGVKVLAIAPADSHEPIAYPIAVIEGSPHPEAAQTFIDFLATDTARENFAEFGFDPLPPSS